MPHTFATALIGLLMLTALAVSNRAAEPPTEERATKATMQEIYRALAVAFRFSLDPNDFEHPRNREKITQALEKLAASAAKLAVHTQESDASFRFAGRSLTDDARQALQRFREGTYAPARFILGLLTEDCFACHSMLPSERSSALGESFITAAEINAMPPQRRAKVEVATRRFHQALETYESMFLSQSIPPQTLVLSGVFEDYLKISIRVLGDFNRPLHAFRTLKEQPDLPRFLSRNLEQWIAALTELQRTGKPPSDLEHARDLILRAQAAGSYPGSLQGLIYFVTASAVLHGYITSRPSNRTHLAEAYYLLGIADSHISKSLWFSETGFFLEQAIRLAPASAAAREAYAFLEEYTILGYSGSSGTHLPSDVAAHLNELRELIESQQP